MLRVDSKQTSQTTIHLHALPNVEFVHGYPGIPAGPDRLQAAIRGILEVRLGSQTVKAKWIKVEFRKIETIPGGNSGEEFIDLIGQGPMTIWQAHDENDTLTNRDFPINIRIPETIPPSITLERGGGIRYEVHATLCVKGKKGIFRREASSFTTHKVTVTMEKHELHSTWPIYAQPESRQILRDDGLVLIVDRGCTCFAPGDRLAIMTTLKSDNLTPVVLRSFELSLEEVTTYKGGSQSHNKKTAVQSPVIRVIGEQKLPLSVTLYGGTQHRSELGCIVPVNHTTSTVTAGRHIDVTYKLRVKAILDRIPTIMIELPVTITNWPRNISADITRRIGNVPNLSLKSTKPRSVKAATSQNERPDYGYPPAPPAPTGTLPNVPNGRSSVMGPPVPPKSDVSVASPASPSASVSRSPPLGLVSSTMNPYSFQQISHSVSQTVTTKSTTDERSSLRSRTFSNDRPPTIPESTDAATGAGPDEFGYNNRAEASSDTVPTRVPQRSMTSNSQKSSLEIDDDNNRRSHQSHNSESRRSVGVPGSTNRRTRAISRLQVVNATDDIPEEVSPVTTEHRSLPFSSTGSKITTSSSGRWATAEQEKQRLYETAKANVERVTGSTNLVSESPPRINDSTSSNGHIPPSLISSPSNGRKTDQEPNRVNSSWATAEQEKQRLYESAQAQVRKAQGLPPASSTPSPPLPAVASPMHTSAPLASVVNRSPPSFHSRTSSDSTGNQEYMPGMVQYIPSRSAGAALYSKAMSSINRAASAAAVAPASTPVTTPQPRRNASVVAAGGGSSDIVPFQADADKSVIMYIEAKRAVQRRQMLEDGIIPDEAPMSYDQLFGQNARGSTSGSHLGHTEQPLSEKELLRRRYETLDTTAAAPARAPPSDRPYSPAMTQRSASFRSGHGPHDESIPEKERMRRAFEARDAALRRAGLTPPVVEQPAVSRSPSAASNRRNGPASYDMPPPLPAPAIGEVMGGAPLTAVQEKAQLAKQYAREEAAIEPPPPPFTTNDNTTETENTHDTSGIARERSFRSDTSEVFLRRDPTISEGKKRASQIVNFSYSQTPPPPPLPPHPPQEYIEETRIEDKRTTILNTLPPDFTSSFDIGFDSFGQEATSPGSSSRPG